MNTQRKHVLWWGRFDPDYSRNRILRQAYRALGWTVADFHPLLSAVADLQARLQRLPIPDLVHVPCFRQRDIAAARRYSVRHGIPLIVDPLISAYDKQVYERTKFGPESQRARQLLHSEQRLLQSADVLLADTHEHARYFSATLGVAEHKIHIVHVGAEEPLFSPAPPAALALKDGLEILFYGSFLGLQGPTTIIEAARLYAGAPVRWHFVGNGPLLAECRARAQGLSNVVFEDWLPYAQLPDRIRRADILLGIFGTTEKSGRVIPNKIYQALACGKPVVTRHAPAYPKELLKNNASGMTWVAPGDGRALAEAVATLAHQPERLPALGAAARATYEKYFSAATIMQELRSALEAILV